MSEIDKKIEEAKKKETVVATPVLTTEKAREHIKKIDEFLFAKTVDQTTGKVTNNFEGRPGFNPHLYRTQALFQLENDLQLIEDKAITDSEEVNKILAAIMAIPTNVIPDAKALSRDSLIARDRRTMKK